MSSFKITKQVGSSTIEFTETYEDHKELFRKASFITSLPDKCGKCGGGGLAFIERGAENKEGRPISFYYLACLNEKCRWEYKYGQHTNQKTLFPKGWEPPYQHEGDFYAGAGESRASLHSNPPQTKPAQFAPAPDLPLDHDDPRPEVPQYRETVGSANEWRNHPASTDQLKKMWALAKKAGLEEDTLKEYIFSLFGKQSYDNGGSVSTKSLTKGMAGDLIDRLGRDYGVH